MLHGKHATAPVLYQPFGPWIVPWRHTSLANEYDALRRTVGLIDGSTQALIEVRGADRVSFLHNLLTNDLKRLVPGTGCQAALLDASAKLIAPMLVLADADALWLLCELDRATVVMAALNRYLFAEQVTLVNHERQHAVLALEGPRATELLCRAADTPMPELPNAGDHGILIVQGIPVRAIRYSLIGGHGALCLVALDDAQTVWEHLQRVGVPFGLQLVGWEALNVARIEAGIPWFGIDMDETHLLPETGLQNMTVSDTKGCYLGQEIIARLQTYGSVSKRLVGLLVEGDDVPRTGDRIVSPGSDETLGSVTSSCNSPALHRPIALGYVKRGAYDAGTRVDIVCGKARVPATVQVPPLAPFR
ncbi:MAG: aminomethyl transferase family protein [Candidatus Omnitrophica bacterium]|nr:aminomethyl transferase family protein [Candidatus Omnitrophota bacterium]